MVLWGLALFSFNLGYMDGVAFPNPQYAPVTIVLLFSIVGFASSNERVHGAIGIVAFVNMLGGFGTLMFLAQ